MQYLILYKIKAQYSISVFNYTTIQRYYCAKYCGTIFIVLNIKFNGI
jgi:hypothetical protein